MTSSLPRVVGDIWTQPCSHASFHREYESPLFLVHARPLKQRGHLSRNDMIERGSQLDLEHGQRRERQTCEPR